MCQTLDNRYYEDITRVDRLDPTVPTQPRIDLGLLASAALGFEKALISFGD